VPSIVYVDWKSFLDSAHSILFTARFISFDLTASVFQEVAKLFIFACSCSDLTAVGKLSSLNAV
jgi:hypothetical protein